MLDPREIYDARTSGVAVGAPVMVHALRGFMDAGEAGAGLSGHLLDTLPSQRIATFHTDELLDYRSRRPTMAFEAGRWTSYDEPQLVLDELYDLSGTRFLLLHGIEPDIQWERFIAAVIGLVEQENVSLTVGVHGIPMAVPHTRPLTSTAHATRAELIADEPMWFGAAQIPASASALLEMRLGEAGHDGLGFAVHVPHYLAQTRFPQASSYLLGRVAAVTGLDLPTQQLEEAGVAVRAGIDQQVAQAPDVAQVVAALEQQYDSFLASRDARSLLLGTDPLPTADEIGAEFERFLASHEGDS